MLWLLSGAIGEAHAQAPSSAATDRQVMAAYVYRFLSYVEWPPSTFPSGGAPIVIGVIGAEDIASELEQVVQNRSAQGRAVVIRRLPPSGSLEGLHVLFVGHESAARVLQKAPALHGQPVLTITDNERGIELGSVINFVVNDGRVRFEIGADAATKNALKLSSRLLNVAIRVRS